MVVWIYGRPRALLSRRAYFSRFGLEEVVVGIETDLQDISGSVATLDEDDL